MLDVSIVIPTYQRRASLERSMRALLGQTLPPDRFEVVVVVDGSTDGTLEMLSAFAAPYALRVVDQPNRGRAAARNAGLKMVVGQVVLMLDDDMEPEPGLLAAHLGAHASPQRVAVLGPVPVVLGQRARAVTRYVGVKFNEHLAHLELPGTVIGPRDFYSGNFSIQHETMLAIGLFDEDFAAYGNEDIEYCLRLLERGVQLIFCAEAVARQHYEKDLSHLAQDQMSKAHTALLLAAKHPQWVPQMKLSTFAEPSWRWRMPRAVLLALTRLFPPILPMLVATVQRAGEVDLIGSQSLIGFVMDYCFWAAVEAELAQNARSGRQPVSLAQLTQVGS